MVLAQGINELVELQQRLGWLGFLVIVVAAIVIMLFISVRNGQMTRSMLTNANTKNQDAVRQVAANEAVERRRLQDTIDVLRDKQQATALASAAEQGRLAGLVDSLSNQLIEARALLTEGQRAAAERQSGLELEIRTLKADLVQVREELRKVTDELTAERGMRKAAERTNEAYTTDFNAAVEAAVAIRTAALEAKIRTLENTAT